MESKTLAIITARGGSKRIPRKNIRDFLGHPIIEYSIKAAVNANCFDEIMDGRLSSAADPISFHKDLQKQQPIHKILLLEL